ARRAPRAQWWPCHQQPFTKMTLRRALKTRSGLPGRSETCNRYRNPAACSRRRTTHSGLVSFPLIARIVRDRTSSGVFIAFLLYRSRAAQGFIAPLGKPLKTLRLGLKHAAQTALNLSLRDHLRQTRNDQCPAGYAEIRMRAKLEHAIRNDARSDGLRDWDG